MSIRVIGICGSLNRGGATRKALELALGGAREYSDDVALLDLVDYELEFYGRCPPDEYPEDVARLRAQIRQADGIILATPEYHGGPTGALKNMLDLMSQAEFETKILGILAVAGGPFGATNSLNALRTVGRNLHAWVLPMEVSVASSHEAFADDGSAIDAEIGRRLNNLGAQVVKFASVQKKVREDEFAALWAELPTW